MRELSDEKSSDYNFWQKVLVHDIDANNYVSFKVQDVSFDINQREIQTVPAIVLFDNDKSILKPKLAMTKFDLVVFSNIRNTQGHVENNYMVPIKTLIASRIGSSVSPLLFSPITLFGENMIFSTPFSEKFSTLSFEELNSQYQLAKEVAQNRLEPPMPVAL